MNLETSLSIGTIQWDFQYLECAWLLCGNLAARGNFISEIDCAYQNLKKWPLGGQNGDFILSKLNNQLVNHRVIRKSIFLLHFWKVHGIWILNQSKKAYAGVRYYGLQLLENCKQFSTPRIHWLNLLKLLQEGYFHSRSRLRLTVFAKK